MTSIGCLDFGSAPESHDIWTWSCRRAVPGDRRAASGCHFRSRADGARLAPVPVQKGGSGGPSFVGDPRTLPGAPGGPRRYTPGLTGRRSNRTESATSAPGLRRTTRHSPSGGLGASRVRRRKADRAGAGVGAARKLRSGDSRVPRHRARHPSHRHPLFRRPDVGTSDRDRRTWIPLPLPPTVGAMPWDLPPATTGGP